MHLYMSLQRLYQKQEIATNSNDFNLMYVIMNT